MMSDMDWALGDLSGDVYFSLMYFSIDGEILSLIIDVTYEDDDEVLQKWEVQCFDFQDHQLDLYNVEEIEEVEEHPKLWRYNQRSVDLFFKGKPANIHELIGELYVGQQRLTGGMLLLETFLNCNKNGSGDLEWLLSCGQGQFSQAPQELSSLYEKILLKHGIKTSGLSCSQQKQNKRYRLLLFGDSYVIAERFVAKRLS